MQKATQFGGALGAEDRSESLLRTSPSADGRAQPLDTGFGQAQFLAAAIGLSRRDREETFAL